MCEEERRDKKKKGGADGVPSLSSVLTKYMAYLSYKHENDQASSKIP